MVCPDDAPPYSFRDAQGQAAGILPEFWRLFARNTGQRVELLLAPGAEALLLVEQGRADVHAGLVLSEIPEPGNGSGLVERFAWTRPLLDQGIGVFSKAEAAAQLAADGGRRLETARMAAGLVTADNATARFLAASFPALQQREYPDLDSLAAALALDQVRVAVGPVPAMEHRLRALGPPERFTLLRRFPGGALRAVVRGADQALLARLNAGFESMNPAEIRALERPQGENALSLPPWLPGLAAGLALLGASLLVLARARRLRRAAEARSRETDLLRDNLLAEMARHRKTQDLLTSAIDQSPSGIIIAHEDNTAPLVFNSEALRILGLESAPTLIAATEGTPWRVYEASGKYVPLEDQPIVAALRRGQTTEGVEYRIVFPDGTERWVLTNAAPVRDAQGRVRAGVAVFQDTTNTRQAERELARFKFFIDAGVEEIYLTRPNGTVAYVNEAVARSLGYPRQELLDVPMSDLDPAYTPDEVFRLHQRVRQSPCSFETVQRTRDGRPVLKEIKAFYMRFGDEEYICAFGRDITEKKRLEQELERTRALFRASLEQAPWGIVIGDAATGRVSIANNAAASMLGVEPEILVGMDVNGHLPIWRFEDEGGEVVTPGETPLSRALMTGECTRDQEVRFFLADGGSGGPLGPERWLLANASPVRAGDGSIQAGIMVMADISARKRMEQQLVFKALHDSLTGLPNRALCLERIQQALDRSRRDELPFAVAFADLDRFKMLNDSLGHSFGDHVLVEAARRLAQGLADKGGVCRFGGDEFVLLVDRAESADDAQAALAEALRALSRPMNVEGQEVRLTASVGVVLGPAEEGVAAEHVLQNADLAMHRAKDSGRDRVRLFHPGMLRRAQELLALDADMRRGLERDEFLVYYQPIMSADGARMLGVEALARWQSPTRGLVTPHAFISHAEESGLIVPLGEQVLRLACRQMTSLRKRFAAARRLTLAVNLSARQFAQPDIVDTVRQVLRETGLPPALLKLELTESTLMGDPETALSAMRRLKALGVSLAIDDFGTGYSSLAYLQRFPVDLLKIDRSFVRDLPREDADSRALVGAIAALAGSLRLSMVAEGVETREQLDLLVALGCEAVQGFYFHPPLSEAELAGLLARDEAARDE
ncbi:EAL domain-containing protein [Humidesulfovibrio sp.]|uniref:EAL domain-containing protein n=1 Tax=Humidesulfovibrio sp. TaxID=2910988 RepID=UPI002D7EB110|nr:EAL domain-containing protein [Humidesulfovibrio sp.]